VPQEHDTAFWTVALQIRIPPIKNKRVRSFIHLARMAYRHEPELLNWDLFQNIMSDLKQQYHSFIECGALS
ncbi:hypothetical protein O6D28_11590, partial [Legionella pneumophila]|nr:hypothetical protein [Legionella pneumophila]